MITEIWKPIKNYEGLYKVSSFGRIKSLKRIGLSRQLLKEIILRQFVNGHGYASLSLCKDCKIKTFRVHCLVAQAFILNKKNKPQLNHINGNKMDARASNLEWVTQSENMKHAYSIGLKKSTKKKVAQIKNKKIIKVWESRNEAAEHLKIWKSGISSCCNGRYKSCNGLQWKYI